VSCRRASAVAGLGPLTIKDRSMGILRILQIHRVLLDAYGYVFTGIYDAGS